MPDSNLHVGHSDSEPAPSRRQDAYTVPSLDGGHVYVEPRSIDRDGIVLVADLGPGRDGVMLRLSREASVKLTSAIDRILGLDV